ncbi:N-acetylglucosamine-6-phosphate deacetylase [Mesoplasma tabanidae]|uniref:N-acetylglucosamine-6-phosphate deacetylase n=1 Tax=Mesoplasma tabanidae TaxID=219745 RepID=A0A2K8P5A8_9MOLU|nr:N-acetylglucosamine-6-phosphate deacetylase [Mesoplasma tabanidae]ATZ21886.1 N-acetylglucosamine-6-phosphate deacetylase [Mesoplasma tabanidae]
MIIKNGKIVTPKKVIENGYIEIIDSKIFSINEGSTNLEGIDVNGAWIMPGFIDAHVHGGYGVDFETGNKERFNVFSKNVAKEGVTKYYQATVTNSEKDNNKYLTEFNEFMKTKNKGAKCLGIHMEGPFISKEKKGAHDQKLLIAPNIELAKKWNYISGNNIKIITFASDLQDGSFTKYCINNDILPSVGHSNMEAKEFEKDYLLGIKHVCHIFNGMSGVDQRKPGLATAALNYSDVLVEVISDGIHINNEILKLIYKIKGPEQICIITDSMNAKGLDDGKYKIGNLEVIKKGMTVKLTSNGVLAGAAATFDHNVRYYKKTCNIEMIDLAKMTSSNIAKQMKLKDTGSIEVNKLADIVVLDNELKVLLTIGEGQIIYKK